MAKLNVNPTRMELSRLKKKLATSTRSHKLLKDKQDELVRQFIVLVKENNELRKKVEFELETSFKNFMLSKSTVGSSVTESALAFSKEHITVDIQSKNVMSVSVPVLNFKRKLEGDDGSIYPYGFATTSPELDDSVNRLYNVLPSLLRLTEIEKSCQLMADEIEKTRRRVNALEYMTIPQLQETIRFIKMKLEENERSALTRLMKVKDIINAQ
ncbi:V-type ATP synthase subunit D (plasmid) [Clostridium perfringens]